jgi:hypothetical protein
LVFGPYLASAAAETDVWYEFVEKITKDVRTPAKRSTAIAELSDIVSDPDKDMRLREYAAEKLGNLEAIKAKDMLKKLAEKLEFSDSERQLKRATTLAYWKIQLLDEPNEPARDRLLIKLLWGKTHPPPHADVVQSWAADELANRGVKEALHEIIESIKYRNSTKRGRQHIWLCKTKIELLTSSESRCEALFKALLITPDPTDYQRLKKWTVEELAKLKSCDGRWLLLYHALSLQNRCYDKKGKPIVSPTGRFMQQAGISYRAIIKILRDSGMTEKEINAMGLRPYQSFALDLR